MQTDLPALATAFGYAGVLANMAWPLLRRREHLLGGQVLACVLMLTHFSLLGAATGVAIMAVAGLQASLAIPLGRQPRFKFVYLASLLLTPVVCVLTWQGPQSVFSSAALAIVCVANFQLDPVRQRALLITALFAWFAHNVLVQSTPGMVSNVLVFFISVHMLVRTVQAARRERGAVTGP